MKFLHPFFGSREQRIAEPLPPRGLRITAYAVLFLLGAAVSVCGAFVQTLWPPLGVFLALAACAGLFYGGLRATGTKLGAGAALGGWFLVLAVLLAPRPEGDLVLSATLPAYLYLFGGSVIGVVCTTLPTRSGFLFGVPAPEARRTVKDADR
ncbi:DUF6113 family protein [Streptomyces sp. TLI_171]|uniref:DUF6113 family protein n=1 Tax=Streptomyces sp. TLI_171 TaxID=1938859 RepID=UPI000C3A45E5|nr:DUF6113 family protein [Streptomyces sp. TLI_171]RKE20968.1 hypothetical protein BX266_4345 [Streptomyces sp. TLI_171]